MCARRKKEPVAVRPSQAMCLLCRQAAGALKDAKFRPLAELLRAIDEDPRLPLRIRTLTDYDPPPFPGDGTPGSRVFNILRDQVLLKELQLAAGAVVPAASLFERFPNVRATAGICSLDPPGTEIWEGCPFAGNGDYEKGLGALQKWLRGHLPSKWRTPQEREQAKAESVREIYGASRLRIFPNHLNCITCHYGNGLEFIKPNVLDHDNLWEVAEAMRRNPDIPVTVVSRHCMVCPPCSGYDECTGFCGVQFPDAEDSKASHALLAKLGLAVGDTLPAGELMRRVYRALTTTVGNCGDARCNQPSSYHRGRTAGLGFLAAWENPEAVVKRVEKLLADSAVRHLLPERERAFMDRTVRTAERALRMSDRSGAYRLLTDRGFWNCWKTWLEKADTSLARLPKSVARERVTGKDGLPVLAALRTPTAVQCDGLLTEPAWRQQPVSAGFLTTGARPAVAEIGVRAAWDRFCAYFAFLCAERDTSVLRTDAATGLDLMYKITPRFEKEMEQGMGAYPWHEADDSLSIFLQPDEAVAVYYHFIFNAAGTGLGQRFDARGGVRRADTLHGAAGTVGVDVKKNRWSAEVAIPFRTLGVSGPGTTAWRVNFHRVFGQDLPSPRIRFDARQGFEHIPQRPAPRPPCDALRAPESWSYSPGNPWHMQWHDLSRMGRLVFLKEPRTRRKKRNRG